METSMYIILYISIVLFILYICISWHLYPKELYGKSLILFKIIGGPLIWLALIGEIIANYLKSINEDE